MTEMSSHRNLRRLSRRYKHTWDRLGPLAFFILLVGTVVILAGMGFLTFLWVSDEANPDWHRIAVKYRMDRTVTVNALALPLPIGFQAVTCTSMLAAIAIEIIGISAGELASISIMRNANSGPFWLTWLSAKALRLRAGLSKGII